MKGYLSDTTLARLFEQLAAVAPERTSDPRLKDLKQIPTVCDGTVFRALPRMACAAGVRFDAVVRLGCKTARNEHDRPVRLIRVHVPARPARSWSLSSLWSAGSIRTAPLCKDRIRPDRVRHLPIPYLCRLGTSSEPPCAHGERGSSNEPVIRCHSAGVVIFGP